MRKLLAFIVAIVATFGVIGVNQVSANEGDEIAVHYACFLSELSTDPALFTDVFFQENPAFKESAYHKPTNMYRMGYSIQYMWLPLKRRGDSLVSYAGSCEKALATFSN